MVALTFFRTEIFGSRICFFMKKRVTKNLKNTEFTLGSTLGTCTLSPSLTPPKLTEVANLECHRMDLEASNQW